MYKLLSPAVSFNVISSSSSSSSSSSLLLLSLNRLKKIIIDKSLLNFANYVQGQSPEPRIREYFYYIDHQGMLFLDDARIKNFTSCFKDKKFIQFFFKRLRKNSTDRYKYDFPYLSMCGNERNYVRCDDLPIVYTRLIENNSNYDEEEKNFTHLLSYANADDFLTVPFQPDKIFMSMKTGRVYHPGPKTIGGIGLLSSKLAIEFSKYLKFSNGEQYGPTNIYWENVDYELNRDWYKDIMN